MSATITGSLTQPWYRQFWPWFIISLVAAAVIASCITLVIAIRAAPERVDYAGAISVPVEVDSLRRDVQFDLRTVRADHNLPATITVTLISQNTKATQTLEATRVGTVYRFTITPLEPGSYQLSLGNPEAQLSLHGNWDYPAPVWKIHRND